MRGEARGAETGAVTGARMDEGLYGDGSEEDEEVVVGEGAEAEMVEGAGAGAEAGATSAGEYDGTTGAKPEGAGAPDGVTDPLTLSVLGPAATPVGAAAGLTIGTYTIGKGEGPDTGAAAVELGEPYVGGPVVVPDMVVAIMGAAAGPVATAGVTDSAGMGEGVAAGVSGATGAGAGAAGVAASVGVGEGVAAGVSGATGAGAGAAGVGWADTLVGDGEGLWREASGAAASGVAGASAVAATVGVGLGEAATAVVLAMTGEAAGVGDGTGGRGTLSSSPVAESRVAMDLAGWTATGVATVVPNAGELTVIG